MKKIFLAVALAAGLLVGGSAQAFGGWYCCGGPSYYSPSYYYPETIYYQPAAPVFWQPSYSYSYAWSGWGGGGWDSWGWW